MVPEPERLAEVKRVGKKPLPLSEDPGAAIKAATDGHDAGVVLDVAGKLDALRLVWTLCDRLVV